MLAALEREFADIKPVVIKKEVVSTGAARAGNLTNISHAVSFGRSYITVDLAPTDRPRGHLSAVEGWAVYRPTPDAPEEIMHLNMLSGTRWSVLESHAVEKFELEAESERKLPPGRDVRLYVKGEVVAEAGQRGEQHARGEPGAVRHVGVVAGVLDDDRDRGVAVALAGRGHERRPVVRPRQRDVDRLGRLAVAQQQARGLGRRGRARAGCPALAQLPAGHAPRAGGKVGLADVTPVGHPARVR
jgi:hypothetical protein